MYFDPTSSGLETYPLKLKKKKFVMAPNYKQSKF